jgi:hypothetical protein
MSNRSGLIVPAVVACLLAAPVWAADETAAPQGATGEPQLAVWADKELTFVYQGFTTRYSCDGLRDKVRGVLLDLGAQKKSLKIQEQGCTSASGRPEPFPGVHVKMRILLPTAAVSPTKSDQTPVPAHWRPVDLKLRDSFSNDSGECELVEQIRSQILPHFSTRNVELNSNCVPHQASATRPSLKMEVLVPDPPATPS